MLASAALATAVKIHVAGNTIGTNDVLYWTEFAQGVERFGPVGIYGESFSALYNHPPLTGWLLVTINFAVDHIGDVGFWIRSLASIADACTALILFELLRSRRRMSVATGVGVTFAWSPIALIVSGFHGNTDAIFVLFALIAIYFATNGRWLASGLSIGVAISIKLVPVILLPTLLALAWRSGRTQSIRFALGGGLVFASIWLPVLIQEWAPFRRDVLAYTGIPLREWGVPQVLDWFGAPPLLYAAYVAFGSIAALLFASLVPALFVWRSQKSVLPASALAFSLFLLISPAFSMQYLVWPLAAILLMARIAPAVFYHVAAGLFALVVYSQWAKEPPGRWNLALATPNQHAVDFVMMAITWSSLALIVVASFRELTSGHKEALVVSKAAVCALPERSISS